MTGIQSLEARTALGGLFAIASYILASSRWIHRAAQKSFDRAVYSALVASRLGLYLTIFFIFHVPARGDVLGFYYPEAREVMHHLLPYRDIGSCYAPLHPYLDASLLLLWNSPLAIILFAILLECFVLPVWVGVARLFVSESCVRIAAVLYLTSAVSVQFVTIDGQNNVIIALLLGLAVLAFARNKTALCGAFVAGGTALVKFLPLIFAPVFLLITPRRLRWFLGFTITLIVGYGYFAAIHLPLLYPFYLEHADRTASNFPYVADAILNITPPGILEDAIFGLSLLVVLFLVARIGLRRPNMSVSLRAITFGCAALTLAMLFFSRKSWPPYLVLVLFPICLLSGEGDHRRLRLALFAVFNVVAVTTHSIWATIFSQFLAQPLHHALVQRQPMAWVFLFTQILLVAGYAWLLVESIDAMLSTTLSEAPAAQPNFTPEITIE